MLNPPIFASLPSGTPAQQFMHRARMFRRAASDIVAYSGSEQFLPKYFLLVHAIELALKAFTLHFSNVGTLIKRDHNLIELYKSAIRNGLKENIDISDYIKQLKDLHCNNYFRYPDAKKPITSVPDLSSIADRTVDYLLEHFTRVINPA